MDLGSAAMSRTSGSTTSLTMKLADSLCIFHHLESVEDYRKMLRLLSLLLLSILFPRGISRQADDNRFWKLPGLLARRSGDSQSLVERWSTPHASQRGDSWSYSMRRVDPRSILRLMIDGGGLLIPALLDEDINILRQVFDCRSAELDVVDRKLILYDVVLTSPKHTKPALRIGKISIAWDSYFRPCLDVQVEDVHVHVEFTNLMLTRNNWQELQDDYGFPPKFTTMGEGEGSFVRFNSIDLAHKLILTVESGPLKKDMGSYSMDLTGATKGLSAKIRKVSDKNHASTGTRGITTTELAKILQTFFFYRARSEMIRWLDRAFFNPTQVTKAYNHALDTAGESLVDYALAAAEKTTQDWKDVILRDVLKMDSEEAKSLFQNSVDLAKLVQDEIDRRSKENSDAVRRSNNRRDDKNTDKKKQEQSQSTNRRKGKDSEAGSKRALFQWGRKKAEVEPEETEIFFPDW